MVKILGIFLTTSLMVSLMGCNRPDSVTTIRSPLGGVFYTVEVSKSSGPTSDFTRVYAHLERNGKAKKILVLDGENLTVGPILWSTPHDATLCLQGGITDTFRNEVTLIVGDTPADSETIHHVLQEQCKVAPQGT